MKILCYNFYLLGLQYYNIFTAQNSFLVNIFLKHYIKDTTNVLFTIIPVLERSYIYQKTSGHHLRYIIDYTL